MVDIKILSKLSLNIGYKSFRFTVKQFEVIIVFSK